MGSSLDQDNSMDVEPRYGELRRSVTVFEWQRLASGFEGDPRRLLWRADAEREGTDGRDGIKNG